LEQADGRSKTIEIGNIELEGGFPVLLVSRRPFLRGWPKPQRVFGNPRVLSLSLTAKAVEIDSRS
jgi:hypothetical protein